MSAATLGAGAPVPRRSAYKHRRRQAGRLRAGAPTTARLIVCLGCIALAVITVGENMRFRIFEAWLAGHLLSLSGFFRAGSVPGAPIIWFAATPHRYLGLLVTSECTVAIMMTPFLLCTAWNIWRQPGVARPLLALGVALALLTVINQLRLIAITCLVVGMGISSGFYWGHTVLGSLITVFGVMLVFFVYIVLLAAGRPRGARLGRRAG